MAATTWMIHQKKNDLQHMDHSLRQQTESLVEKRNQLETDMERLVFFHDLTRSYWSRTLLIQSLMETAPKGLRIKKLEIFGSTVEIEGLAPNASAFMTALSSKKEIQAARFTSPLKKDSKTGMEKFTLVFETLALAGKRQYGKD
jgi:Tfp pilus assembly protein PilN